MVRVGLSLPLALPFALALAPALVWLVCFSASSQDLSPSFGEDSDLFPFCSGAAGGVALFGDGLEEGGGCFCSWAVERRSGLDLTFGCRRGSESGTGVPGVGVETNSLYELSVVRGCFHGKRRKVIQQKMIASDHTSVGRGSYFFSSYTSGAR